MHELSLVRDVIAQAESVSAQHGGRAVTRLRVSIGLLSGIEPSTFRDHFSLLVDDSTIGSPELTIDVLDDLTDPRAASVVLDAIGIAEA